MRPVPSRGENIEFLERILPVDTMRMFLRLEGMSPQDRKEELIANPEDERAYDGIQEILQMMEEAEYAWWLETGKNRLLGQLEAYPSLILIQIGELIREISPLVGRKLDTYDIADDERRKSLIGELKKPEDSP